MHGQQDKEIQNYSYCHMKTLSNIFTNGQKTGLQKKLVTEYRQNAS